MRFARTERHLWCGLALMLMCAACGSGSALRAHELALRRHAVAQIPELGAGRTLAAPARSRGGEAVDPSAFSPGACVSYAPVGPSRHRTVFLDAGHGGLDPGAVGTTRSGQTVHEAPETLAVELDAMAILRGEGFRVVVSRTRDTTVLRLKRGDVSARLLTVRGDRAEVVARDACANDARANVLVGIYFDAGAPSDAGCVTGYDTARSFARHNFRLARLLQTDVLAAMNAQGWAIPNGGVQPDTGLGSAPSRQDLAYGHLLLLGPASPGFTSTPSDMPGALIEPLFITDPFEGTIAASRDGQRVIARGLANALNQYFGPV
jgi:N-acetylmuramoyl-L-alanine amidase